MITKIHSAYINALLADVSYVRGLQEGQTGDALFTEFLRTHMNC